MIFDGVNTYLNGFSVSTSQFLSAAPLITEGTILTFTISQSGNVLVCCSGSIAVFSNATTAVYVGGNFHLRIRNSSGTVVANGYSGFQMTPTNPHFIGAIYPIGIEIPVSSSLITNLAAGAYTVTGQISATWYDSGGSVLSPSANNSVLNGLTYFYQVKV
jgi:hypothetical protein